MNLSHKNISKNHKELLDDGKVKIVIGDGRKGWEGTRFDVIHVGAASKEIPGELVEQLEEGGRMVLYNYRSFQWEIHTDNNF